MNKKLSTLKHHILLRYVIILKVLFVICGLTNELNADGIRQFGLTGGTKGIGMKYSNFGKYFGVDIGFPIYYKYDKRIGDTSETIRKTKKYLVLNYFHWHFLIIKRA